MFYQIRNKKMKDKLIKAISICASEKFMRERVFKNQPEKLDRKLADIDLVLEVLHHFLSIE
jgi:hypothetical protein